MENIVRIARILFAVPWLIFGIQHFMFVSFVANIVPAFMPMRSFWAYFTGAAMIAAGISFIINKKSSLAAFLLGIMLMIFVLLIHVPILAGNLVTATNWTRALQDLAIAAAAFMLANILSKQEIKNNFVEKLARISRYVFALLLIVFGVQQFLNLDFLTAKVPAYLPLRIVWVYFVGAALTATGISVLINKKAKLSATLLGILLLIINLLFHVPLLISDVHNPLYWTAVMIDLAITGGVFILAGSLPKEDYVSTD